MGEIKSTLDLVMERTRHLSMSAEDKARQRQADFAKRLQGLLQQYDDGLLTVDRLRDRINVLQAALSVTNRKPVLTAIIARIDLEKSNRPWLTLLADLAPAASQSIENILVTFQNEKAALSLASMQKLREAIARQHGINGSAVVPNPEKSDAFLKRLAALRQKTQARINTIVGHTG